MIRLALAIVGTTVLLSGPALAGGLQAPAAPDTGFDWTGLYVGVNGGFSPSQVGVVTDSSIPKLDGITRDVSTSGGVFGGTAGFNTQIGSLVIGLEGDLDGANITGDADPIKIDNSPASVLTANIDWLATLRGRVGMTMDKMMFYATAGVAGGGISGTITNFPSGNLTSSIGGTQYGYALGAGLEAALTDHLTAKAEYLYMDLGTASYELPPLTADAHPTVNIVRAGLNYKF